MAALTIRSGLAGFRLVQRIHHVSENEIIGQVQFNRASPYTGLEAMAQLGALDVRRRIDFKAHAFLLKIIHCRWPAIEALDGVFRLRARSGSRSRRAFVYHALARSPAGIKLEAQLMFGTMDYDTDFQEQYLRKYYRELFLCLQNATTRN